MAFVEYTREDLERKLAEERESHGEWLKEHYRFGFEAFLEQKGVEGA